MSDGVRMPRLLDANLQEARRLKPTALSLNLNRRAISTAQITLPGEDEALPLMGFAELYLRRGSAGIFRVKETSQAAKGSNTRTCALSHAVSTLHDSVWRAQEDFSGTVTAFLTQLLSYQQTVRWQLGTVQDTGTWKKSGINYDHLDTLLYELAADRKDYLLTFDFSTSPWTLNFVQASGQVDCEMRMRRNLSDAQARGSLEGMCNRLYLTVHSTAPSQEDETVTEPTTQLLTYNDTASQAEYGVIEGTADIDTADVPDVAAWVAAFFQEHAAPQRQTSADGYEVVKTTGEPFDQFDLGKRCRIPALQVEGPVESIRFENLLSDPDKARLDLNQKQQSATGRLHSLKEQARAAAASARSAGYAAKKNKAENEKEKKRFDLKVEQDDEKFSILATDTEWDEMGNGHVTAFTHLTRTAHYVQDEARKELPFADWKAQYLAAHPEEAGKTDAQLREIYEAWITANPYAIYNVEYNDATRSERIISKTGINSLGQDETIMTRQLQEADRIGQVLGITSWTWEQVTPRSGDNPSTLKWYELVNGVYKRSTDTSVVSGKTYYVPKANLKESSALLYRNEDGQTVYYVRSDNIDMRASTLASWGVYTDDTLSAGILVDKVNSGNTLYILGEKVVFGSPVDQYVAVGVQSTDNPKQLGYYELSAGTYTRTQDEEKVPGKTYYKKQQVNGKTLDTKIGEMDVTINGKLTATQADIRYATIQNLRNVSAKIDNLTGGTIVENFCKASLVVGTTLTANNTFVHDGDTIYKRAIKWYANEDPIATVHALGGSAELPTQSILLGHYHAISASESNGVITITQGAVQDTAGAANFNIADTQFYKDGVSAAWDAAAALTVPPSDGTGTTFVFKAPKYYEKTQGNWVREQVDYTFTISKGTPSASGGYAAVTLTGHNQPAARIALDDWYNAGWDAAAALTVFPDAENSGTSFTVSGPKHYEKTQGTWVREQVTRTYTLTTGTPGTTGYAAVSDGTHAVAKISIGNWYTAGQNDVTLGTDYNTSAQESTASTDQIKFLGKRDGTSTIDVNVGVRLTNGQQFSRWITDITVPSSGGGGSTADKIDLSSFTWRDSSSGWSTSGSTSLGTLSDLILQHKNDRGYIHFDATCTDGTGTKRYYVTIG